MTKKKQASLYMALALMLSTTANLAAPAAYAAELPVAAVSGQQERASIHRQAIALARKQNYPEALQLLKQLYESDSRDKQVLYDYIAVLQWSGDNRAAVDLFTTVAPEQPPDYVLTSVGGAYYQLGDFAQAASCYQRAAEQGNAQARLWQAQSLYRNGDRAAAEALYGQLLRQAPADGQILRSRGLMYMQAQAYELAAADFAKALTLAAGQDKADTKRELEYDMAVAYLRLGDPAKAIVLLRPYVESGQANVFMQADYILALKDYQDYKAAAAAGSRLWPDWRQVPVFGLQAYADVYVRLGERKKAIPLYEHVLTRDANAQGAKLSLAFSYMMTGNTAGGLAMYEQLITGSPVLINTALDDANYYITQGKEQAGTALYTLLINRYPDNSLYRQEYANALAGSGQPRAAYYQYRALAQTSQGQAAGLAGMVNTALAAGDNQAAAQAAGVLRDTYADNLLAAAAVKDFDNRRQGQMTTGFSLTNDYHHIERQNWQFGSEQALAGNFSLYTEMNRDTVADKGADLRTTVNTKALGLGVRNLNSEVQAWYLLHQNNGNFSGYRLTSSYYPSDHVSLGLAVSRRPLAYSPESLNPELSGVAEGRIMTNDYAVTASISDGKTNTYEAGYTRSLYSDANQVNSYNASWSKQLQNNERQEAYRTLYWNYSAWQRQRPELYDSPTARDTAGVSWTKRWKYNKHYWEASGAVEWGRDRPEATELQPHARLEYGFTPASDNVLRLAAEYGTRSDRADRHYTPNRFSYLSYEINYQRSW